MIVGNLDEMLGGWFVGDFEPTLLKTKQFEVAVKRYSSGDLETKHTHKVATEITVITSGRVRMNNTEYVSGNIIVVEPGETTDFMALEDSVTVVVKIPSIPGDKYVK